MPKPKPYRKLIALRAEHNMTQLDMAELLDISETTYINKEKGRVDFTVSEVNIIIKFFGIKYEDIFLRLS